MLLVLLAGCTTKTNTDIIPEPDTDSDSGDSVDDSGTAQDDGTGGADDTQDDSGAQDPFQDVFPTQGRLLPPLNCSDRLIAEKVAEEFGSAYTVSKAPPQLGKTVATTICFLRENNVPIVTYYFQESPRESIASDVLEDEKNQYVQQLFSYTVEEPAIGSKGYLIVQPVKDAQILRLIFIDDSNKKAVVFIKSTAGTPRSTVENLGRIIERLI